MSFGAPLVLLALLGLPLLFVWYRQRQRERRAAAAAFATPALQPSVAPVRPGWRRHAPMLAFALAVAVLVIAAARPQRTVAVPVEQAAVVLASDVSGSMTATDVAPTRLTAAKRAARRFVDGVPAKVNVGVLAFNHVPTILQSPTRDRIAVKGAIDQMAPSGGTATGDAINAALQSLRRATPAGGTSRPPAAIVLLSDGASTRGTDPVAAAQEARKLRIPIYTVALGTPQGTIRARGPDGTMQTKRVPPDEASLAAIARASGGKTFSAQSAGGLSEVYAKLGSQLGTKKEKQQVTSAFAGGGLVLMLAGAAMSLGWFGRLT
jgi:Ca-activated chloride channel family protein